MTKLQQLQQLELEKDKVALAEAEARIEVYNLQVDIQRLEMKLRSAQVQAEIIHQDFLHKMRDYFQEKIRISEEKVS